MKEEKQPQIVPVQYIPMNNCDEDEIDLRELFQTIWKYKIFILVFTFIITISAGIYAFSKTPIYEVESFIQLGYNSNSNSNSNRLYFLNAQALVIYIQNKFDHSNDKIGLPIVKVSIQKHTNDILDLKIENTSNEKALKNLDEILQDIKSQEDKRLKSYIDYINTKISILSSQKKDLIKTITNLQNNLKNEKNPQIYQTLLDSIAKYKNSLLNINLQIADLKSKLSAVNITRSHIIGNIKESDYPIKPKKKLIVVVAFVTGFILSIFLVFFIEFIRSEKEEK